MWHVTMFVANSYVCNKHLYFSRGGQHLFGGGATSCFVTLNKIFAQRWHTKFFFYWRTITLNIYTLRDVCKCNWTFMKKQNNNTNELLTTKLRPLPLVSAQIILHSMHKYQPRVHVIRKECGEELSAVRAVPVGEGTRSLSFTETVFTTVTAYQNQQVVQNRSAPPRQTHRGPRGTVN